MRNIRSALFVALLMVGAGSANGQSAESILRKYYNAIGGTENWNKINSIHTTFSLTSAGGEMHGSKTVLQGKGSKKEMNININGKNMVTYTVVTPTKGWFFNTFAGKMTPMSPEKFQESVGELDLHNPLNNYFTRAKTEYAGKETLDGKNCLKIKAVQDSTENMLYFDASSYLLLRVSTKTRVHGKDAEAITDFSDYKKLPEGVYYPMTVKINSAEMQGMITMKYQSVDLNQPVDEKIFKDAN